MFHSSFVSSASEQLSGSYSWTPKTLVMAGSRIVVATAYIAASTNHVIVAFDLSGQLTTFFSANFGPSPEFTSLGTLPGRIFLSAHMRDTQKFQIWSVKESDLSMEMHHEISDQSLPIRADSVLSNELLVVRLSIGPILLFNGTAVASLEKFGLGPPLPSRTKKMIFSTQSEFGRLYFPGYDNSYGEVLYRSQALPCFTANDCIKSRSGSSCAANNFCSGSTPPLQPPSRPPSTAPVATGPRTAPPPAPKSAPVPVAVPTSPLGTPVSLCVPPAPPGAVCTSTGWFVNGSVVVPPTGVTITSPTVISGNLTTQQGANLTIQLSGGPNAPLVVQGCVSLGGNLVILASQGAGAINMTLLTFAGYCGPKSKFDSVTVDLGCSKLKSGIDPVKYGDRSLTLVFGSDDIDSSGCPAVSNAFGTLSTPAIVGITVGAVVFVALVICIVLWVGRYRFIPYFAQRRQLQKKLKSNPDSL